MAVLSLAAAAFWGQRYALAVNPAAHAVSWKRARQTPAMTPVTATLITANVRETYAHVKAKNATAGPMEGARVMATDASVRNLTAET